MFNVNILSKLSMEMCSDNMEILKLRKKMKWIFHSY